MSKVVVKATVSTGQQNNMYAVPGTGGYLAVNFPGYAELSVVVLESGATYIKPVRGYCQATGLTYAVTTWCMYLFASPQDFTMSENAGEDQSTDITDKIHLSNSEARFILRSNSVVLTGASGSATGTWDYSADSGSFGIGDDVDPTSYGYVQVADIMGWPGVKGQSLEYYIGGYISTNNGYVASTITSDAAKIIITAEGGGTPLIEYVDKYYPWQKVLNGSWVSLNRDGGSQTNTGLFRYSNGWQPETNSGDASGTNHGFRYNNGWQKSPKVG